jgi:CPA2 family monovalent cation:H+ antiporter-2
MLGGLADHYAWLDWVTVTDPGSAAPFAELGVLFLLFLLGLELSFARLWSMRRAVLSGGGFQSAFSAASLYLVAIAIGLTAPVAIVIGLALAFSSTAIVMQTLTEERRAATPLGRAVLSVLLMQDILVAPILILVSFLARDGLGGSLSAALLTAFIQGVLAVGVILFIGRFILRPAFRTAAKAGGRDLMMAIVLATLVGASLLTAQAGLSLALGAFLAGLLLGETEFRHQAEVDLEPFKGLLIGVFFTTVGIGLDLSVILANWGYVLSGLVVMLTVKFVIVYCACRLFIGSTKLSLEAAFLLAPAGEFAFVIVAAATAGGVIEPEIAALVAAIAGLSMLLTPIFAAFGARLVDLLPKNDETPIMALKDYSELSDHVLIMGMGRVGLSIAQVLDAENVELLALDNDPQKVDFARKDGWHCYYGDAAHTEILQRAGAEGASLFAVTLDDADRACTIVSAVRQSRPDAPILARARYHEHAKALYEAGATHVVPEAIEAALQLAGRALNDLGVPSDAVRDRIAQEREDAYARD